MENFTSLVEHHELQLDPSKLDMLLALVQSNEDGQVCYQELIELVSGNRERTCTGANSDASWELLCIPLRTTTRTQTSHLFFPLFVGFQKGYRIDSDRAGELCSGEN